jgi:hypothetical protein
LPPGSPARSTVGSHAEFYPGFPGCEHGKRCAD